MRIFYCRWAIARCGLCILGSAFSIHTFHKHSDAPPLGTGALAQDCDLGAMVVIWHAVILVSLPVAREGRAVDRRVREKTRRALRMCILIWLVDGCKLSVKDRGVAVLRN